eukprot:CAMPEP_0202920090 /NCGR_PEP_ID=MMETSP1392-20130828/76678_1 /ASSEMBLY_ACC=CAM_ASM_000868 /TAXON_ID=225041 /ORGANISM="Chlamydomonas chlamydogama, Strain SAG 11-48b" /LENGTH=266 /DNA_ID=CAMNT_0049613573 /DNA_START=84 /DNA_END=886 /DNA_ORIENTATION=-
MSSIEALLKTGDEGLARKLQAGGFDLGRRAAELLPGITPALEDALQLTIAEKARLHVLIMKIPATTVPPAPAATVPPAPAATVPPAPAGASGSSLVELADLAKRLLPWWWTPAHHESNAASAEAVQPPPHGACPPQACRPAQAPSLNYTSSTQLALGCGAATHDGVVERGMCAKRLVPQENLLCFPEERWYGLHWDTEARQLCGRLKSLSQEISITTESLGNATDQHLHITTTQEATISFPAPQAKGQGEGEAEGSDATRMVQTED